MVETAPETPERPAPAMVMRVGLVSVAVWLAIGLTMLLAMASDALRQGRTPDPLNAIAATLPYFVPLMGGTWIVALAFLRHEDDADPPAAWRLIGPALLAFVPLNAAWGAAVTLWRQGRPVADYAALLATQGLYNLWIDTVIAAGAFAAVAAWSHRRRRAAAERRFQAAQAANQALRLQLLQAQLEPHFLFNTLNGISALVRAGERPQALSALAGVSDLLRHALRGSRVARLPWAEELAFVRAYLALQQLRFGAALQVTVEADASALDGLACPPLLLQPLVENAVRHGVEAAGGAGQVTLRIDVEPGPAGRVHVALDNRPLPPPGEVPGGHGLGLAATRERLTLLFGDRAQLRAGPEGDGFHVALSLPKEVP